ncbi:MAG: hypothetical protein R2748_34470 [Bryobacterales bacterium]
MRLFRTLPAEGMTATLRSTPQMHAYAVAMGWLTVLIEGAVAVAFWLRFKVQDLDIHNWLLMSFCVVTYFLAPVFGFGMLLTTMGLAQCNADQRDARQGFLWTFVIVMFAMRHTGGAAAQLLD